MVGWRVTRRCRKTFQPRKMIGYKGRYLGSTAKVWGLGSVDLVGFSKVSFRTFIKGAKMF